MHRLPIRTVGIIGAGQLGLMLCEAARKLGIATCVLADSETDPAAKRADSAVIGDRFDSRSLYELAAACDLITFEIEHADTGTLRRIAQSGTPVRPSPQALETIRDKWTQRSALERAGIPGPRAVLLAGPAGGAGETSGRQGDATGREADAAPAASGVPGDASRVEADGAPAASGRQGDASRVEADAAGASDAVDPAAFGYPFVQKVRRGGYDGRGVKIIRTAGDRLLSGSSMAEELVDIASEVAVLVARTASGRRCVYPPIAMQFDPVENICTRSVVPAGLPDDIGAEACRIAGAAVDALDIVGICAVELFVTAEGSVLVNELAPRPHNSGHLTLEANITSQFEQHLRAVLDLPLGAVEMLRPAAMLNLLGSGSAGEPAVEGFEELLAVPEAHLHLYDKRPSKPGRKMGHVTICADERSHAEAYAGQVERLFRVYGLGDCRT